MSRYRRYDGGDPLAPPVDLAEALDAIGRDVMAGYSPERAMREFLRRGGEDQVGLDDLARRLSERRQEILDKHDLDGTMREVRTLLDKAVTAERGQLARDITMDDDDRAFRELLLDDLPASTAAAVSELSSYDWQSSDARAEITVVDRQAHPVGEPVPVGGRLGVRRHEQQPRLTDATTLLHLGSLLRPREDRYRSRERRLVPTRARRVVDDTHRFSSTSGQAVRLAVVTRRVGVRVDRASGT